MIKKYYAHFEGMASSTVEFEFDPGDLTGDKLQYALKDEAWKAWQGVSLCHQCGRDLEIGEFDLIDSLFAIEEA